ncbi:MAG TPA: HAD family hydrolase [Candidatus Dormibacteraeota bacterium]
MRQTLIIDGDDTLWENNIYFEQSIEDFIDFLNHSSLTRAQVREALDEIERLNASEYGYGSVAFGRNLRAAYERLAEREIDEAAIQYLLTLARRILEQTLTLLPQVERTLDHLQTRHRLLLFTKGETAEQRLKVERSGLVDRFTAVIVTREKDVTAYRDLLEQYDIDPDRGWMVGNSPRSDINPALAAGLGAVYIPHSRTWRLEQAELMASQRLITLGSFAELQKHF